MPRSAPAPSGRSFDDNTRTYLLRFGGVRRCRRAPVPVESSGEGVGHIAYTVDDLEAEAAKLVELVERGFPVILSIIPAGKTSRSAVYFDTRGKFSNLIIELMQA